MKIAIAGTGYVGLANAVLLSQKNQVVAVDLVQEKVDQINARKSPLADGKLKNIWQQSPSSSPPPQTERRPIAGRTMSLSPRPPTMTR